MKKGTKRAIWAVVIVIIAVFLFLRLTKKEEFAEAAADPVVEVQNPHKGDIRLTTNLIGTIEPADVVYIYPKMGGDVTAVNIKAGDTVTAGQVLVEIDTKQVDATRTSMEAARVSMESSKNVLDRMTPLYASGYISAQDYDGYKAQADAARLQFEAAQINYNNQMEFSNVTSPISGRVEQCNVELHDTVGQSTQMLVIAGENGKVVSFYTTEKVKNNLNVGDPMVLTKDGVEYDGTITEISNMAEASVGLFKVKASVADSGSMTPGTDVELEVLKDSTMGAMLIPANCVYYRGGQGYVYTYDPAESIIHEVAVETGLFDTENIEIKSGLTMDDQVLTTWTSELKEGTKVALAGSEAATEQEPSDAQTAAE